MKKLFAVLMLMIGLFALAGCDLIGGEGNFKEVELSSEELQAEIEKIDLSLATENIVSMTTSIDLSLEIAATIPMYDYETEEVVDQELSGSVTIKGSAGIYANLKSFEEMFILAEIDITYDLELDDLGEDIELGLTKGFIKGKAYLTGGNAYLDLNIKEGGVEVSVKNQIKDVISEQEYEELIEELDFEPGDFDLSDVLEELPYTVSKSKDKYKLEFNFMKANLEELVEMIDGLLFQGEGLLEVVENNKFESTAAIIFSEAIEKISFDADFDFAVGVSEEEGPDILITVVAKIEFELNFKGKMPKLPSQSELDEYPEGFPTDSPIFPSFTFPSQ